MVAVFYGFLVCIAIYREISGKDVWEILKGTAVSTANLMFLVVTAQMFGYLITYYKIPVAVTNAFMQAMISQRELDIIGTRMSCYKFEPTISGVENKKFDTKGIATTFINFSEIDKVFHYMDNPEPAVKKMVIMF